MSATALSLSYLERQFKKLRNELPTDLLKARADRMWMLGGIPNSELALHAELAPLQMIMDDVCISESSERKRA